MSHDICWVTDMMRNALNNSLRCDDYECGFIVADDIFKLGTAEEKEILIQTWDNPTSQSPFDLGVTEAIRLYKETHAE